MLAEPSEVVRTLHAPPDEPPSPETLVAWKSWKRYLLASGSPDTERAYGGAILRFLAATDCRPLRSYAEEDLTLYLTNSAPRGRNKYETVKALRSFFGWALRRRLCEENPAEHIHSRKPRRVKLPTLNSEELTRLLVAAYFKIGERQAWGLLLVYSLGLRRKEAAGLRWSHIRQGEHGPVIEVRETKGDDQREALPLSPLALLCLSRIAELPAPPQATRDPDYILRVRAQTVTEWVRRAGSWAQLEPRKIGAHRLRASLATDMLKSGVDVRIVQRVLGHHDLESTAWYLADPSEAEMRRGLETVGRG